MQTYTIVSVGGLVQGTVQANNAMDAVRRLDAANGFTKIEYDVVPFTHEHEVMLHCCDVYVDNSGRQWDEYDYETVAETLPLARTIYWCEIYV